jgi:CRISPR-associated protein (TIGR03984 family)
MTVRDIKQVQRQICPVTVDDTLEADLVGWLVAQAQAHDLTTLLAHADDGVIWGEMRQKQLLTSGDVFSEPDVSPPLRALTLQQARLFGPAAELLLWRTEGGWQARLVTDDVGDEVECFDEWQILWGTRCEGSRDGFTLVADGAQGLRHAPPVRVDVRLFDPGENRRPLRLQVRHYLETDTESGLLRVTLSRLVQVTDETQVRKEQER